MLEKEASRGIQQKYLTIWQPGWEENEEESEFSHFGIGMLCQEEIRWIWVAFISTYGKNVQK